MVNRTATRDNAVGCGVGMEAHPGNAGRCTKHLGGRVMPRPGIGPQAGQAPPDIAVRHPRSLRGIRSAVCSAGRESSGCLTKTGRVGLWGLCTQTARLPADCLPDQC